MAKFVLCPRCHKRVTSKPSSGKTIYGETVKGKFVKFKKPRTSYVYWCPHCRRKFGSYTRVTK